MARVKGGLFTATLDVNKRFPLDSRMLVAKREDLINPKTWIINTLTIESTYNTMIVSVNADGEYNGVYYLIDRTKITNENYAAYKTALETGKNVDSYFSMWMRLGTLEDIVSVEKKIKELINNVESTINLTPIDGTIFVTDNKDGSKSIGVAIAPIIGNALTVVDGGLFVPQTSVKISNDAHGLVMVDGALALNLATKDFDGAMSKEDKALLDAIPSEFIKMHQSIDALADICTWDEI